MQIGAVVHTEAFEKALKAKLRSGFLAMAHECRDEVDHVMSEAHTLSPVASGQMRDAMSVFEDVEVPGLVHLVFGEGSTLHDHHVEFERNARANVHTHADEHDFGDEWCSMEIVGKDELQANDKAVPRPLTNALATVFGPFFVATNADEFREGQLNVMRFEPILPKFEDSALKIRLEEATRRGLLV